MAASLKLIMGLLGNAISFALYLCPMPTFRSIYKLKSTQEYSPFPYVFTFFNCALGLLYGFVKSNSTLILTINGAGLCFEAFYFASFLIFTTSKKRVMTMRLSCGLLLGYGIIVAVTFLVLKEDKMKHLVVGISGIFLSTVMYASPLAVVKLVIKSKSVKYMPLPLSVCNCLNAIVWLIYSIVTKDIYIGIPNGIGSLLGMVQLAVYMVYRKGCPDMELENKRTESGGDSKELQIVVETPIIPMPKPNQVVAENML